MTNSPFHDPERNPLPDANTIEQEVLDSDVNLYESLGQARRRSETIERDKKRLRNFILLLLFVGLALGSVMTVGIGIFLKRAGLVGPPPQPQIESAQ